MAGNFTALAINEMLDGMPSELFVSLHTGWSATGSDTEFFGGTYARQPATFDAATSGYRTMLTTAVFTTPGPATVYWIGLWDDLVAGNFLGMAPNQAITPKPFMCNDTGAGLIFCPGHNFGIDDQVVFFAGSLNSLPSGFAEAFYYYVVSTETDYFSISLDHYGFGVTLIPSSAGMGYAQRITPVFLDGSLDFTVLTMLIDARLLL